MVRSCRLSQPPYIPTKLHSIKRALGQNIDVTAYSVTDAVRDWSALIQYFAWVDYLAQQDLCCGKGMSHLNEMRHMCAGGLYSLVLYSVHGCASFWNVGGCLLVFCMLCVCVKIGLSDKQSDRTWSGLNVWSVSCVWMLGLRLRRALGSASWRLLPAISLVDFLGLLSWAFIEVWLLWRRLAWAPVTCVSDHRPLGGLVVHLSHSSSLNTL